MSVTIAISQNPPVTVPARATASLASFREWAGKNELPANAKLCYYQGEVFVEMGKEQVFFHVAVKTEISRVLANIIKEQKGGMFFNDGLLLTNEKADLSNNPDAAYISNDAIKSKRIELVEGKEGGDVELLGSADMVLEVVSDSSEKKDNQTLFEAYYEAGVSEYWLVDARGPEIEFHIYKRGAKKFVATKKLDGWVKSACFGKSFRLALGTNEIGKPDYTLEVR
jgi:Uma2 family endonuclease